MIAEFDKHKIFDLGKKLAHLEGIMGAYLPSHVFSSREQQRVIDGEKTALSRMRTGERPINNWQLGRFAELFELPKHGFDYRFFTLPFDAFDASLREAGVGSYGTSAALRLRETLRELISTKAAIEIRRDARLNVGGIGDTGPKDAILCLTAGTR